MKFSIQSLLRPGTGVQRRRSHVPPLHNRHRPSLPSSRIRRPPNWGKNVWLPPPRKSPNRLYLCPTERKSSPSSLTMRRRTLLLPATRLDFQVFEREELELVRHATRHHTRICAQSEFLQFGRSDWGILKFVEGS